MSAPEPGLSCRHHVSCLPAARDRPRHGLALLASRRRGQLDQTATAGKGFIQFTGSQGGEGKTGTERESSLDGIYGLNLETL